MFQSALINQSALFRQESSSLEKKVFKNLSDLKKVCAALTNLSALKYQRPLIISATALQHTSFSKTYISHDTMFYGSKDTSNERALKHHVKRAPSSPSSAVRTHIRTIFRHFQFYIQHFFSASPLLQSMETYVLENKAFMHKSNQSIKSSLLI